MNKDNENLTAKDIKELDIKCVKEDSPVSSDSHTDLWEMDIKSQIRELLKLPMNKRTHFLRVRHPSGGSHL
jgi:hypothetical protein